MSCLRPDPHEPEFEPVTSSRRPYLRRVIESTKKLATASSSPKLRLNLDNDDSLMADADVQDIINKGADESRGPDQDRHSQPLPDLPEDAADYIGGYKRYGDTRKKPDIQAGLQRRLSQLGFGPAPQMGPGNTQPGEARGIERSPQIVTPKKGVTEDENNYSAPIATIATSQPPPQPSSQERVVTMPQAKQLPRASSILPRPGTVTALPGSIMTTVEEKDVQDIAAVSDPSGETATVEGSSICMPPPTTPRSAMPSASQLDSVDDCKTGRKRKLSFSAPLKSFKRIFRSSNANKGLSITHVTHDATATNRTLSGRARPIRDYNRNLGEDESSTAYDAVTVNTNIDTPTPRRDIVTPTFGGPSTAYATPQTPSVTCAPTPASSRSIANTIFRPSHRRTTTADVLGSTSNNAPFEILTSKAALNRLIVHLRTLNSDLALENKVLKDQIEIVKKDWIDASQELDLEKHRSWEREMECFRLKIIIEEMRTEIGKLKRGSLCE